MMFNLRFLSLKDKLLPTSLSSWKLNGNGWDILKLSLARSFANIFSLARIINLEFFGFFTKNLLNLIMFTTSEPLIEYKTIFLPLFRIRSVKRLA